MRKREAIVGFPFSITGSAFPVLAERKLRQTECYDDTKNLQQGIQN